MRMVNLGRILLVGGVVVGSLGAGGCKGVSERYIALEVWKYEKCFGHYPPGFTPPGAAVAPMGGPPAMRPCGQPSDCCQSAALAGGCNDCQGAVVDGGVPVGGTPIGAGGAAALPAGPGGSPGPLPPGAVSAGKPVVISDEVVLP